MRFRLTRLTLAILVAACTAGIGTRAFAQTARDSTIAPRVKQRADSTLTHLRTFCRTSKRVAYVCADTTPTKRTRADADSLVMTSAVIVTPPPPPPPPPPPDTTHAIGEPVFDSTTQTLVFRDPMDEYTSPHAMWLSTSTAMQIRQTDFGEDVDSTTLVAPGRGGSGKALRLVYSGGYQDGHAWTLRNGPNLPDTTTHFFSYWARVTLAQPLGANSIAFKWFLAWHWVNRVQWNTHNYLPCNVYPNTTGGPPHTFWQVYDNGATACQGNQPIGPYPDNVFDGQWHRFTHQYRPNTTAGARDGVARMWVDGTKVIDISASVCGTTPPGGYKTWCDVADIDALDTHGVVGYLEWGSALTTTTPAFTMDIDDFAWWAKGRALTLHAPRTLKPPAQATPAKKPASTIRIPVGKDVKKP